MDCKITGDVVCKKDLIVDEISSLRHTTFKMHLKSRRKILLKEICRSSLLVDEGGGCGCSRMGGSRVVGEAGGGDVVGRDDVERGGRVVWVVVGVVEGEAGEGAHGEGRCGRGRRRRRRSTRGLSGRRRDDQSRPGDGGRAHDGGRRRHRHRRRRGGVAHWSRRRRLWYCRGGGRAGHGGAVPAAVAAAPLAARPCPPVVESLRGVLLLLLLLLWLLLLHVMMVLCLGAAARRRRPVVLAVVAVVPLGHALDPLHWQRLPQRHLIGGTGNRFPGSAAGGRHAACSSRRRGRRRSHLRVHSPGLLGPMESLTKFNLISIGLFKKIEKLPEYLQILAGLVSFLVPPRLLHLLPETRAKKVK